MSNTLSYMHTFSDKPAIRTVGAVYLAKPPSYHHITSRFPTITPEVIAAHQSGERPAVKATVEISSDFEAEAITQVMVDVVVDLSDLEKSDTIPCEAPRPHLQEGKGYVYRGKRETDIDLLLSLQWKRTIVYSGEMEEYVGTAFIFNRLHYVWRREMSGDFVAQLVPTQEM